MPENPSASGFLRPDIAKAQPVTSVVTPPSAVIGTGAGAIDALSLFRTLLSSLIATSFQLQQRDQFGGQIYIRSNTNLENLATQLGYSAIGSGNRSTAVGSFAYAREDSAVALGVYALALGPSSVAIGDQAMASTYRSIVIGNQGQSGGIGSIAIGFQARAAGQNSIAIGSQAFDSGNDSVAIGTSSRVTAASSVAIGAHTSIGSAPGMALAIAIGANASVVNTSGPAIAIGSSATVTATTGAAIAFGYSAAVTGTGTAGIAIGERASVSAAQGQAWGTQASAPFGQSIAVGQATVTTSANQMMIGNPTYPLSVNISGPTPWVDVIAYGAKGDGTTSDITAIQNAITAVGASGTVFFPPGTYRLASDLTIASSVSIRMATGAMFTVDSGKTLTISGGIDAGLSQIFSGSGAVVIELAAAVYPQWFGAMGDGKQAFDAVTTTSSAVVTSSTIGFDSADVSRNVVIEGADTGFGPLLTTIASVTSSTQANLATVAVNTTSASMIVVVNDNTTAIDKAIQSHFNIRFPSGIYGATTIRMVEGTQFLGETIDNSILARVGVGSGGEFIGMATGEAAQKVQITDVTCYCGSIGSGLNGIDFAVQGNNFAFANMSWMDNVRVVAASGTSFAINSNVGKVGQLWAMNLPAAGSHASYVASRKGFVITNTQFIASLLSAEGFFESGDFELAAGGSNFRTLQSEPLGNYATAIVTMSSSLQTVGTLLATPHGASATRRTIYAIAQGNTVLGEIVHPAFFPITLTNTIEDTYSVPPVTIAYASGRENMVSYSNGVAQGAVYNDGYKTHFFSRLAFGGGTVAAANDMTLPYSANAVSVTGTTEIHAMTTTDWPPGSIVVLIFNSNPLVKFNTAGGASTAPFYLWGLLDFQTASNDVLTLVYNGTAWYELARSLNVADTATVSVRKGDDSGSCNLIFRNGLFESTTC